MVQCVFHKKFNKKCDNCQTLKALEEYRRKTTTPRSQITHKLRALWLWSRERNTAIRRDNYTCQKCYRKQTMAKGKEFKVSVHHKNGIDNWEEVVNLIYKKILCRPEDLETICPECHLEEHRKEHEKTKENYNKLAELLSGEHQENLDYINDTLKIMIGKKKEEK